MSQVFECAYVTKNAPDGSLAGRGVRWTENAAWNYNHRADMWIALGGGAIGMLISLLLIGSVGIVGIFGFGWMLHYTWGRLFGPLPVRSVMFLPDGTIAVPHGLPRQAGARTLRVRHEEVATFQDDASQTGMRHDWTRRVGLVTYEGETINLSEGLHSEEAREVVTKLTNTLAAVRRETAGGFTLV